MLLIYHISRLVRSSLCVGVVVRLRTENKTTDVVNQQHKFLKMDILMPET